MINGIPLDQAQRHGEAKIDKKLGNWMVVLAISRTEEPKNSTTISFMFKCTLALPMPYIGFSEIMLLEWFNT